MAVAMGAVTRYTLVELTRRRILLLFLVLELLLAAGLGMAPFVIPGAATGEERSVVLLSLLSGLVGPALFVCAIALGATVIRHDLDSGAIVAILAKPLSRLGYAGGKLAAAAGILVLVDVVFAALCTGLVAIGGGGHVGVLLSFFAVEVANAALLMVLIMVLTVRWSTATAAVVGVAVLLVDSVVSALHSYVQSGLIAGRLWRPVIEVGYWLLPHALTSDLEREVVRASIRLHPETRPPVPLVGVPGPSTPGDVAFWFAYLAVLVAVLCLALRRKQV